MLVVGIDEVGRGCWAGPLVAGAVLLEQPILGLRDSKKLSKLQRQHLDGEIRLQALDFGLGWVSPIEIDTIGLTAAVRLAMQRALEQITKQFDEIIIDGNLNFFADNPLSRCLIKADDSIPAVSAASILAKVARDAYMRKADLQYSGYDFANNVGYGTASHTQALHTLGMCDLHRRSFEPIRKLSSLQT